MAKLPRSQDELAAAYGPHLNRMEGIRLDTGVTPDRVVDTHCCFCGQQCGIRLKVKDNTVIGFEPRYDFPFNRGMLCPKGVKRYLRPRSGGGRRIPAGVL
jgi:assimilatory nitrate reductase catalytic subunit